MNISIFSQDDAEIAFIARSLPAHDCHGVRLRADIRRARPDLLIVDVAGAGAHLAEVLEMASTQTPPAPVLLLAGDTPQELAQIDGRFETEFKPLRRHAVAARVRLLLRRTYPEHDECQIRQFGDYAFETPAHAVTHAGRSIVLTHKEFALAVLLFSNLGRPLSRAYMQEAVWGAEEEHAVPTRTIDTHVSRVRSKLQLRPDNGFRLSTVYGYGYQLEQLGEL